jgi:protocatechuate 3,4-dioxygenase beta subunit
LNKGEKVRVVMTEYDESRRLLLSRREALVLLGAASAGWLITGTRSSAQVASHAAQSPCILRPEQTEGPYFVDERLHRSDIRSDPTTGKITPGIPFALTFHVFRLRTGECHPLPNVQVDVWHCDAAGVYSDVDDPGSITIGQKFLRGYQVTDAKGEARFLTIYPGWYPIRAVHIHFKVRTASVARRSFEFTSQVYFPDELTDQVHAGPLYSSRGVRKVRNRHDFIFRRGGEHLMLEPSATNDGYRTTFPIGLALP